MKAWSSYRYDDLVLYAYRQRLADRAALDPAHFHRMFALVQCDIDCQRDVGSL